MVSHRSKTSQISQWSVKLAPSNNVAICSINLAIGSSRSTPGLATEQFGFKVMNCADQGAWDLFSWQLTERTRQLTELGT